ncbi:hypothetical protein IMG5_178850 [Ichthyophthirius multifiliis]|uniref:XPG-I domain-containing protein n=1 Tax=Ichthyophthirius multifiliis TaxID=5932 RepID=G0R2J3_ICHMU|nr:hypothetical protein IMG5_178850 [Ichthyophthirius multifiliis]EGR28305.1 hypothetical protein IMG5_178850 [Ichthyophthirius multifiliis]|eukprot:XP_004027650.1 hypothetical protein IMG5_178850 [Ichthyophthirius multifiliis]
MIQNNIKEKQQQMMHQQQCINFYLKLVVQNNFKQKIQLIKMEIKQHIQQVYLIELFRLQKIKQIQYGYLMEILLFLNLKKQKQKFDALEKQQKFLENQNMVQALKMEQRNIFITQEMKNDAIKMLKLLGFPVIEAPGEAEAQCAALTKTGQVFATVTEDMDALTFGTTILLRGLNSKKEPIVEINHYQMLKELEFSENQFIDLCILCGCDYLEKIEGIGPVNAYKLIKEFKNLENTINFIEKKQNRFIIPKNYNFQEVRNLFQKPEIENVEKIEIKWQKPNLEKLNQFLVQEKGFNQERILKQINRIFYKTIIFINEKNLKS